jgi:hypothetical protein
MALLPPTPVGVPPGHSFWNDWYEKLRNLINNSNIEIPWTNINDFTGANLTDLPTRNHDDLQNILGSGTHHVPNYSTGTWTPTIVGTTTAGTGTYTAQTGEYTRIGNIVHIYCALTWTAHTGTGNMHIAGLPIAAKRSAPACAVRFSNTTYTGTSAYIATLASSTELQIAQYSSAAAASDMPIDTAASIVLQGSYFI